MSHARQDEPKASVRGGDTQRERDAPMRVETLLFSGGVVFFFPLALIYAFWSSWEPVGTVGFLLLAGLYALTGGYLWMTARRVDARPSDDPLGEIEEGAGELGVFAPHSWWPLVTGLAAALAFLAVAVGWWIMVPAAAVAVIGLVGQLYEFSRGQHAH